MRQMIDTLKYLVYGFFSFMVQPIDASSYLRNGVNHEETRKLREKQKSIGKGSQKDNLRDQTLKGKQR